MGRIAEALKRAEQHRREALADRDEASFGGEWLAPDSEPSGGATPDKFARLDETPEVGSHPEEEQPERNEHEDRSGRSLHGLSESLVPFFEQSSLITEQYRSLRTRLLSQNPNNEHRILAVTSAVPKEGKSVTALNLARILAEIRHLSVLVVDADFRRSSLAAMLNQKDHDRPGLAELLGGQAKLSQALRDTPTRNLKFIGAGDTGKHSAAELLTDTRARRLMRQLQHDFHYTIVDTPPATTVPDVGIIGQLCSGVLMVIRLHRTNEPAAKRAVRLLQANNIPIIGCLLVGRDLSTNRYGYGYAYHYYRYYDYYTAKSGEKE